MPKGRRGYTQEEVLRAIEGSRGIVLSVAERLQCDWNTARKYIDRWKATRQAFQAERETLLDLSERTIVSAIQEGDVGSAKWVLARLGKTRGYTERQEVTGADGHELVFRVIYESDGVSDQASEAASEAGRDSGQQGEAQGDL